MAIEISTVGNYEQEAVYRDEALELCRGREESDPYGCCVVYSTAGLAALNRGDLLLALDYAEKRIEIARRTAAASIEAQAICTLVQLAATAGDYERADDLLAAAVALNGVGTRDQ